MSIETGGQAFPRPDGIEDHGNGYKSIVATDGMTLRDYFAAKAMQGILASEDPESSTNDRGLMAKTAYEYADAMLAARSNDK